MPEIHLPKPSLFTGRSSSFSRAKTAAASQVLQERFASCSQTERMSEFPKLASAFARPQQNCTTLQAVSEASGEAADEGLSEVYGTTSSSAKERKRRTIFDTHVLNTLNDYFVYNEHPSSEYFYLCVKTRRFSVELKYCFFSSRSSRGS